MSGVEPASVRLPAASGLCRRDAMKIVVGAASVLAQGVGSAQAQNFSANAIQSTLGEGQSFSQTTVADLARLLAKKPFAAPPTDLPDPFANLNYEQYIGIRAQPSAVLWSGEGRGFTVEPLHRGFAFTSAVTLYLVEDGTVRRVS
jgi:periplasmic glucans biosynthesis protein